MRNILVTGGAGFIGPNFCDAEAVERTTREHRIGAILDSEV